MASSPGADINECSNHFLLVLGYIHLKCIDFDSEFFCNGIFIPSQVIERILQSYRHRYSVYAIGMNKYEEFGDVNMNIRKSHILHHVNIRGFQKCDEFSHLLSSPISDCIYYGRHRFMIKHHASNRIYVAGHNNLGQCGVNSNELEIDEFTELIIPKVSSSEYEIVTISNGICAKHSFIIIRDRTTSKLRIYAFGTNKSGQFGTDNKFIQPQLYPLELPHLSEHLFIDLQLEIVQICCGEKHSIFLAQNGRVLGCGLNENGQCGIEYDEDYEYILEPEMIEFPESVHIAQISCGREHNLCLDRTGKLWVFGVNTNGELGIGDNKNENEWIDVPQCVHHRFKEWNGTPISSNSKSKRKRMVKQNKNIRNSQDRGKREHLKIVHISAGERHSLFIDERRGLWLCGSNWYCQIGNDKSFTECQKWPFRIQSMRRFRDISIVDASCGDYHTVMLDEGNNVYTFGANDSFQCHPPLFNGSDLHKISMPLKIERRNINIGPHDVITRVLGAASSTLLIVE